MDKALREKMSWKTKNIIMYILLGLYKISFGLYLRLKYNVTLSPGARVKIKGPYLLLSNHCSNYDGLFLQYFLRQPVRFLVTDAVFKNRMLRALLSLAGYIPKKKFVSDAKSIRRIIKTVKNKGAVGIFPEGARSWDGKSLYISDSVYKLVKHLNIPVVTANIRGSYFCAPRWAETKRRGRIEIDMKVLLDSDDIRDMSVADINEIISCALEHNEFDWQQINMIPFRGKALAEGLERLIYMCPECRSFGSLRSARSNIYCTACCAEYHLDEYGLIHSVKGYLPAQNLDALNDWQYEQLELLTSAEKAEDIIILSDNNAVLLVAESDEDPFIEHETGSLNLCNKKLVIGNCVFNIEDIYGLSIYFKSGLSFRYASRDYRICFSDPRISVYKWRSVLGLIKGIKRRAFDG